MEPAEKTAQPERAPASTGMNGCALRRATIAIRDTRIGNAVERRTSRDPPREPYHTQAL